MMIKSFWVQNYKGFRERQEITLAPLTLFYGSNGSGKSSLLRVLPWISESLEDERPGPCLDGNVVKNALWNDIVHIATPSQTVNIGIRWDTDISAEWRFRRGNLPGTCEIGQIRLQGPNGVLEIEDDGDGQWHGSTKPVLYIAGLMPFSKNEGHFEQLLGTNPLSFEMDIQWLAGIRTSIPRIEQTMSAPPVVLASDGQAVARHLFFWERVARDILEKEACEFVKQFFIQLGYELRTADVAPGFFRVEVVRPSGHKLPVNLVDTGEGLTQVLAPVIALARAASGLGPGIVAMEQPELHLHTDAQRVFAETLAQAVNEGAQALVETHSEVLLASIQLAISQRKLKPEQVALYWVDVRANGESIAHRVTFNEQGHVSGNWPIDAFDDLLNIKSELYTSWRKV